MQGLESRSRLVARALRAAVVGATLALCVPRAALAGEPFDNHIHGLRFDIHADVGGYASLGAGFRVDIPLVPNGFLTNVDDEFALSPGFDLFFWDVYPGYYDGGLYFLPSIQVQWNFYVHPKWSIFPEVGIALYVSPYHEGLRNNRNVWPAPAVGFGARYHFSARNALLLRASTPTGLQVGLTF